MGWTPNQLNEKLIVELHKSLHIRAVNVLIVSCRGQQRDSMFVCPHLSGWPGAPHSVDICEGLEDWSGSHSPFPLSDTEEEDIVHLVSPLVLMEP